MARVRAKDTQPEKRVRSIAHILGLRFRLHRRDLKGTPDLLFPKHNIAMFVHGCFWHQHLGCKRASIPQTRQDFWLPKLARNVQRDKETAAQLRLDGWRVEVIWECETKDAVRLEQRLSRIFFGDRRKRKTVRAA
jgi:DNA mismatch endonuclease (patch repair protein)